jgi:hypothetical protein
MQNIQYLSDSAQCLYCNHICQIKSWGKDNSASESYLCPSCHERFELVYENDQLVSFIFTCNTLNVVYFVELQSLGVQVTKPNDIEVLNRVWIPEFNLNFKDKDSLIKKLSNCLLF